MKSVKKQSKLFANLSFTISNDWRLNWINNENAYFFKLFLHPLAQNIFAFRLLAKKFLDFQYLLKKINKLKSLNALDIS